MVTQECKEGEVNISEGNIAKEWSLVTGNPFGENPSNLLPSGYFDGQTSGCFLRKSAKVMYQNDRTIHKNHQLRYANPHPPLEINILSGILNWVNMGGQCFVLLYLSCKMLVHCYNIGFNLPF